VDNDVSPEIGSELAFYHAVVEQFEIRMERQEYNVPDNRYKYRTHATSDKFSNEGFIARQQLPAD
jgi:hypothetical protein